MTQNHFESLWQVPTYDFNKAHTCHNYYSLQKHGRDLHQHHYHNNLTQQLPGHANIDLEPKLIHSLYISNS